MKLLTNPGQSLACASDWADPLSGALETRHPDKVNAMTAADAMRNARIPYSP
jgi:hypothetical protein